WEFVRFVRHDRATTIADRQHNQCIARQQRDDDADRRPGRTRRLACARRGIGGKYELRAVHVYRGRCHDTHVDRDDADDAGVLRISIIRELWLHTTRHESYRRRTGGGQQSCANDQFDFPELRDSWWARTNADSERLRIRVELGGPLEWCRP